MALLDEVGVVVVDGNFDLYGKIRFTNKIILKQLGYQTGELLNKQIHCLMPTPIAEIHNYFWVNFAKVGIPKVLD
jgi:hypothetical protein